MKCLRVVTNTLRAKDQSIGTRTMAGPVGRSGSNDNDEETGNETLVEHTTDSSEYDSDIDYVSIKPRSVRRKTFCLYRGGGGALRFSTNKPKYRK